MNTQEREQLTLFLQQLSEARSVQKDSDAAALIDAACARQPDATYLLVQRAMLLANALQNAQGEITRLQSELVQARHPSPAAASASFLDANAWGNSAAVRAAPSPPPLPALASAAPVQNAVPAASAWGSGLLGTMATTAAGVVAGGFLFQGLGHLLDGAKPGAVDGLKSEAAASAPQLAPPPREDSAGLFDTSSVDDYIAGDTDHGDA